MSFYSYPVWLESGFDNRASPYERNIDQIRYLKFTPPSSPAEITRALTNLRNINEPISFELLSVASEISFQLVIQNRDRAIINDAFSGCALKEQFDPIITHYNNPESKGLDFRFLNFCLTYPFWHSIQTFKGNDQLATLYNIFSELTARELGFYQVLILPASLDWLDEAQRQLEDLEQNFKSYAKKFESQLWACAVRVGGFFLEARHPEMLTRLNNAMSAFSTPNQKLDYLTRGKYHELGIGNRNDDPPFYDHYKMILRRVPYHAGMILNSAELAGLMTPPPMSITTVPDFMLDPDPTKGLLLGKAGRSEIRLPHERRRRHMYIVGTSGAGKSTLITNLVKQDIEDGFGLAVIDPHGALIKDILPYIPGHRISDVILFNAEDTDYPVSLNPLKAQSRDEADRVTSEFMTVFQRFFETTDAHRMLHILRHTVRTLLDAGNHTFCDIRQILIDEEFREQVISKTSDPILLDFWRKEFEDFSKSAVHPILNKLSVFILNGSMRNILCQKQSKIDFFEIMQSKKIFLANLAQGKTGEENSTLLGSLIMSQLQMASMRRETVPKSTWHLFTIYCDEFHNFTSTDHKAFEKILAESRKYNVSLAVAHQRVSQISAALLSALIGVHTILCFQLTQDDAPYLSRSFENFDANDLQNLKTGEAICRVERSQDSFKLKTIKPDLPTQNLTEQIISQSRSRYAAPIQTLESAKPVKVEPPPASIPADQLAKTPTTRPASSADAGEGLPDPAQIATSPTEALLLLRPAPAQPLTLTNKQTILHYLNAAIYLTREQIIQLVYSENENRRSQTTAASRDLSDLLKKEKKIKEHSFQFEKSAIYSIVGEQAKPSPHNIAVRDLFVKIIRSGFEITNVAFELELKDLKSDLAVTFADPIRQPIPTLWEYDAGSMGTPELKDKLNRYEAYSRTHRICFIASAQPRLDLFLRSLKAPYLTLACMTEFATLNDPAFYIAGNSNPRPFFPRE